MRTTDDYLAAIKDKKKALEIALRTREFEIELYWKRTTYFSVIVGALFIAFYHVTPGGPKASFETKLLITGLGSLFSLAWYFANKGSKYWQENWEHHVDSLEADIVGPVFGTVIERPLAQNCRQQIGKFVIGPSRYSVTAINTLVSLFVFCTWVGMFISLLCFPEGLPGAMSVKLIGLAALVVGAVLFLWTGRSTHKHRYVIQASSERVVDK